jgi:hypothetical protein
LERADGEDEIGELEAKNLECSFVAESGVAASNDGSLVGERGVGVWVVGFGFEF